jgi:hypothetical protein
MQTELYSLYSATMLPSFLEMQANHYVLYEPNLPCS